MIKKAIITVIFIILTFTACKGSKAEVTDTELDDYIFNQIDFEYVSDISPSEGLFLKGDFLYFFMNGNETYPLESENSYHICKYNITDNELSVLFDIDSEEWSVKTFYVTEEGDITLLRNREFWDAESMTTKREVEKITYGEDGTQKESIMLGGDESPEIAGNIIDRGKFDNEGNVYIVYQNIGNDGSLIYKYSHKGEYKGRIELDSVLTGFAVDNEGNPVASYNGSTGSLKASYLDFDNGKTKEELKELSGMSNFIDGYGDKCMFASDESVLYEYDARTGLKIPILNWISSNVDGTGIEYITAMDDGWLCLTGSSSGGRAVGIIKKAEGITDDRKVIKIATVEPDEEDIQAIIKYNNSNDRYRVEYVSYGRKEDPQNALLMDILTDNAPDILYLTELNVKKLAANGILEKLDNYLENDDTLNRECFVDGILDATAIDGKQYYVSRLFRMQTFVGRKSDIEDFADGYTVDELIERYGSKSEDMMLFPTNTINWTVHFLIFSDIDRYIDWDTGKCSFDSDDFKKLLGFCREFDDYDNMSINSEYKYDLIMNNKLFLNSESIENTADIQMIDKLYKGDEIYVGYPGDDCNAYLNMRYSYGIVSSSQNKDDAWEVIKGLMNNIPVKYGYEASDFPTFKTEFEEMIKADMDTTEYINEDGMIEGPRNEGVGLTGLTVGPATKEDISTLRNLISNSRIERTDDTVVDIIRDDIEDYFDGKRSLDDTVNIIQDRMVKYVNENR